MDLRREAPNYVENVLTVVCRQILPTSSGSVETVHEKVKICTPNVCLY